jgi:solute carrier family 25 carnitine/acylcarnitine transporter 20/29
MADSEIKNGIIAGITRAIISHPFDTIKTKMQYGNYKSAFSCLHSIVKTEGLLFLYKGIAFPLVGNAFIVGTHFHVYNTLKKYSPIVSGACAGFAASFISNPVELVRIKMQLSDSSTNNKLYKNSFICFKNIIKNNGIFGIFKGQFVTSTRDIIGYSAFFNVFEMYSKYEKDIGYYIGNNHFLHKMIKGTLCGFALWGSMYPIDVIKTLVQGSLLENKQKKYSEYIKEIYKNYGIRGFYRGFYLTMFRAIPVNVGIVTAIDLFM